MTKKPGFSLVELAIYITIVGILAVFVLPNLISWIGRASYRKAESEMLTFAQELTMYSSDIGHYPRKLEDLIRKPTDDLEAAKSWRYAYLKEGSYALNEEGKIADPWQQPYRYHVNTKGAKHPYELSSEGDPKASEPSPINVWEIKAKSAL